MKLDMNLIREILQALKAKDINDVDRGAPKIEGYSEEANSTHYKILKDKGFIQAKNLAGTTAWGIPLGQEGLTLEGGNFLRFLKDNINWSKVKNLEDFLDVLKFWRSWKS